MEIINKLLYSAGALTVGVGTFLLFIVGMAISLFIHLRISEWLFYSILGINEEKYKQFNLVNKQLCWMVGNIASGILYLLFYMLSVLIIGK